MNAEQIKQRQEESKARRDLQRANRKVVEEALLKPYLDNAPKLGARAEDLQYYHDVYGGRTYAVLPPDADELRATAMKLLGGGSEISVNVKVGIAKLNRDAGDNYDRRIGRVIAASKLSVVAMKLVAANVYEGKQIYNLQIGSLRVVLQTEKKLCPKFLLAFDRD